MKVKNIGLTSIENLSVECSNALFNMAENQSSEKTIIIFQRQGKFHFRNFCRDEKIAENQQVSKDFAKSDITNNRALNGIMTHIKNPNKSIFLIEVNNEKQERVLVKLLEKELQKAA